MPPRIESPSPVSAAAAIQNRQAGTPESAAAAFIASGNLKSLADVLAQVPPERVSNTAVRLVAALVKLDPELTKLHANGEALHLVLRSLGTPPYDAGIGAAIAQVMRSSATVSANAPPAEKQAPARVFQGRPAFAWGASMPEGLAQPLFPKTYGSEMKDGKVKTEGGKWGAGRKVAIHCDYEVSVRNPKSGRIERVLFEAVEQKRAVPWGLGSWYDTREDIDSEVLVCEGHQYGPKEMKYATSGKGPVEQWVSGSIERTAAFHYDTIPELKQRVENFIRTGDTGNDQARKRRIGK